MARIPVSQGETTVGFARSFVLRFTSGGSDTVGAMQNFDTGEANIRFGLDPPRHRFLHANYPGLDGESAATHGHFIPVAAVFNTIDTGVPEPGTIGMVLIGLSLALRRFSRRASYQSL